MTDCGRGAASGEASHPFRSRRYFDIYMSSEKEKCRAGGLYDANHDRQLIEERLRCKRLCFEYNRLDPGLEERREEMLRGLLGKTGKNFLIEQPFLCDYGYNIGIGENFYANVNCVILDEAAVTFGDNVFIGPNCAFYTAAHPLDTGDRRLGLEFARPISVGSDVWIGGNVVVLPGVTIGDGCVIGAGSVVTRDIPAGFLAFGNPCRVIRRL